MGLLESFGFDNIELWRSEEMQLVQVRALYRITACADMHTPQAVN